MLGTTQYLLSLELRVRVRSPARCLRLRVKRFFSAVGIVQGPQGSTESTRESLMLIVLSRPMAFVRGAQLKNCLFTTNHIWLLVCLLVQDPLPVTS